MIILIPASIVALATIFRVIPQLWGPALKRLTDETRETVASHGRSGQLSLTDARVVATDMAGTVYMALQPLAAVYAIAPMFGALGTVWSLSKIWQKSNAVRSLEIQADLAQAFVPLAWGLVIGLVAITGFALLKARLVRVEISILAPAAIDALSNPETSQSPTGAASKSKFR